MTFKANEQDDLFDTILDFEFLSSYADFAAIEKEDSIYGYEVLCDDWDEEASNPKTSYDIEIIEYSGSRGTRHEKISVFLPISKNLLDSMISEAIG